MKSLKLSVTLIAVLAVLLCWGCSKNSTDSGGNGNGAPPRPPGVLYFSSASPARIYQYDIPADRLQALADENQSPKDLSVSYDGGVMAYISGDSLIGVIDLPTGNRAFFTPPERPGEGIAVDHNGGLAAFTARRDSGSVIALLNIPGGIFTNFTGDPQVNAAAPCFSRQGFPLAWRQNDGLYIRSGLNGANIRLDSQPQTPRDFSPAGGFLAVEAGKVFDLAFQSAILTVFNGSPRFLDERTVLYQDNHTHIIYKSGLDATSVEAVTGVLQPAAVFAPSPDGRFLAYFHTVSDSTRLIIQNLAEKRNVLEKTLFSGGNTTVETAFWRNKPIEKRR